jgi:hypothetical protein
MGLSQVRGGGTKKGQVRKTARRAFEMTGGALPINGGEMTMAGSYHGGAKHTAEEESDSDMEESAMHGGAYGMGKQLSTHLHSLHGAGFWDDFKSGFMSVVSPVAGIAKSLLPLAGPSGALASQALGALGMGKKKGGRKCAPMTGAGLLGPGGERQMVGAGKGAYGNADVPAGAKFSSHLNGGVRTGAYEGKGKRGGMMRQGAKAKLLAAVPAAFDMAPSAEVVSERRAEVVPLAGQRRRVPEEREAVAEGQSAAKKGRGKMIITHLPEGHGEEIHIGKGIVSGPGFEAVSGGRKRKPVGPNDRRRARAEVVKKVMRERGVSMIEASKIVKAENLF